MTTQTANRPTGTAAKNLTLGHSPDPDDAFMFYGLAAGKIDAGGWHFEHVLQDIQTLNDRALRGELDITAISIHAYPYVADKYVLTNCGSSMGDGYGPMIVAREPMTIEDLRGRRIAVPGLRTTAYLALQLLLNDQNRDPSEPRTSVRADSQCESDEGDQNRDRKGAELDSHEATKPRSHEGSIAKSQNAFVPEVIMFDEILHHVEAGRADAGLIIHEGQLTYANHKLHLVVDLGAWWKSSTGLPLPLGGNVIRRELGRPAIDEIAAILKRSIEYSLAYRAEAVAHAMQYARDMGRNLADKFVGMYVNDWTLDYGSSGREAVRHLLRRAQAAGLVPDPGQVEFIG